MTISVLGQTQGITSSGSDLKKEKGCVPRSPHPSPPPSNWNGPGLFHKLWICIWCNTHRMPCLTKNGIHIFRIFSFQNICISLYGQLYFSEIRLLKKFVYVELFSIVNKFTWLLAGTCVHVQVHVYIQNIYKIYIFFKDRSNLFYQ